MKLFLRDCIGAVTIDWVTLTSTVLIVGIMVVHAILATARVRLSQTLTRW